MERSGTSAPAVHDHGDLAKLLRREGPFVTVWASRPDLMPKAVASRVRDVQDSIGTSVPDLPDSVLDDVLARVQAAFPDHPGVVIVADGSGVQLSEALLDAPKADVVKVGAVPSLAPVVEHRQSSIPFALVVADRRGADLYWSEPEPAGGERSGTSTVDGDETFIRKVQAGGWSHRTFQQRAENTWEHTADQIAAELTQRVDAINARVVAVAGDVRMTQLLRERLPESAASLVREVPGSRSEDGSGANREAAIRRWVRTAIAEDTVATLRLFHQERGQLDRAADGVEATFAAIREARVDILLVHDTGEDDRLACFAPDEPTLVATSTATLRDLGRTEHRTGRLVDVAIRAAILTGAGIRVVPETPRITDGIGAILRW